MMWKSAKDLPLVARRLARSPAFSLAALVALALGVGTFSLMFTIVRGVLLEPLPFRDAERLVLVAESNPEKSRDDLKAAPAKLVDWRSQTTSFREWAAFAPLRGELTGTGEPIEIGIDRISPGFFHLLGIDMLAGRSFLDQEDQPGHDEVAILGAGLWRQLFGADPDVVGRRIELDGMSRVVVGVAPEGLEPLSRADVFIPLVLHSWQSRVARFLSVAARLEDGVAIEQAAAELSALSARLAQAHPATDQGWTAHMVPLREQLVGEVRPALLLLLAAVTCVLLIACVNVAALLLARGLARRQEIAMRLALGAGAWTGVRLLVAESLVLAFVGGALGLLLVPWGLGTLLALCPVDLPRGSGIGVDAGIVAMAFAACLASGVAAALAPAIRLSKLPIPELLGQAGGVLRLGHRQRRLFDRFMMAEVAVALVLLSGAGALLAGFQRLRQVPPGFQTRGVLTLSVSLPRSRYPGAAARAEFCHEALEQLGSLNGVLTAGAVSHLPLSGSSATFRFLVEGEPPLSNAEMPTAGYRVASAEYFRAMGIPMLKGRSFTDGSGPAGAGIVINQTMQRRYWPGEEALGKRLSVEGPEGPWLEIVGVVGDVRHFGLDEAPQGEFYARYDKDPWPSMTLVVKSDGEPMALVAAVREQIRRIDPELPISDIRGLEERLSESLARPRFHLVLLAVFAGLALTLAAVGLYGTLAYSVRLRTHEIGVRLSLGAEKKDVMRLVVRHALKISAAGAVVGLVAALYLNRFLSRWLGGASVSPMVIATVAALVMATSLVASWLPARRAARIDPVVAFREAQDGLGS